MGAQILYLADISAEEPGHQSHQWDVLFSKHNEEISLRWEGFPLALRFEVFSCTKISFGRGSHIFFKVPFLGILFC